MNHKTLVLYLSILFMFTTLHSNDNSFEVVEVNSSVEDDWESSSVEIKNSWGIEFNFVKLHYSLISEDTTLSGGINYFNYHNNTEIAIPITYNKYNVHRIDFYDDRHTYDEIDLNIDIHYRKFLHSKVGGLYAGIFARYTYLEGKLEDENHFAQLHKFGLGAELGYRQMGLFGGLPLYWGISIALGKYFSDYNDIFDDESAAMYMDDPEIFFDVELLKFGLEF